MNTGDANEQPEDQTNKAGPTEDSLKKPYSIIKPEDSPKKIQGTIESHKIK